MKQHEYRQTITVHEGLATLETGETVNLLDIQAAGNAAFRETGDLRYAEAADEMAKITGMAQGPNGDFEPVDDNRNIHTCPMCGGHVFNVAVKQWVTIVFAEDGDFDQVDGPYGDSEWDDDAEANCDHCLWRGTLKETRP